MPEYVYALHTFAPEHEDEIAFEVGQPIEVIEKDDQYNDGWWQVSTLPIHPFHFPNTPHMYVHRTRGPQCAPLMSTAHSVHTPSPTLLFVDVPVHSVLTHASFSIQGP